MTKAASSLITEKPSPDVPKDQIVGVCLCARGSTVRLDDATGRTRAELILSEDTFTFANLSPGRYRVSAEDRVTHQRASAPEVANGSRVTLRFEP